MYSGLDTTVAGLLNIIGPSKVYDYSPFFKTIHLLRWSFKLDSNYVLVAQAS